MAKTIRLDLPKKLEPLFSRTQGIRDSLLATHKAGKGSPSEVIGNEREIFLRKYLEAAYPKPFRFSSGFIIDKNENKSGQLDIIAEKLHSISFPASANSEERLYLAEMVSAVISVKSNLNSQWSQVESEIVKLTSVQSKPTGTFQVNVRKGNIPFFVVAYSGAKKIDNLDEKLSKLPEDSCLEAIVVLDANIYAVNTEGHGWMYHDTESSFLYFICDLHREITRNFAVGESIWEYACEVIDN